MTKDNPNGPKPGDDLPETDAIGFDLDDPMDDPMDNGAAFPDIEAIIAERDEFRDRFMRALADAENARKRAEKDRRDAEQYGGTRLARDLLPVHDNLTRALAAATDESRTAAAGLIEGIELTLRDLENTFQRHGITLIAPDVGEKFDPQLHEAMFEAPAPGTLAGHVIQLLNNGFMLHDRLLRPAQVGVSSTPAS